MEYVGCAVIKSFGKLGKFKGSVVGVQEDDEGPLFRIRYEDGDEEDVELKELKRIAQRQPQARGPSHKRKAVGDAEPAASPLVAAAAPGAAEAAAGPGTAAGAEGGGGGGGGSRAGAAARPAASLQTEVPHSVDEGQLRGMVEEVAAQSRDQEVGLVRHRQAAPAAPGALLCSRAVTCGGMCYTSAIRPSASYPPEVPPPPVAPGETPPPDPFEQYEAQARDVLEQLDGVLREAGSSRGHLVSLQVLLKDVDAGLPPFAAAFKAWVSPLALPAVVPQESYLGVEDVLISVAATAAVPARQDD